MPAENFGCSGRHIHANALFVNLVKARISSAVFTLFAVLTLTCDYCVFYLFKKKKDWVFSCQVTGQRFTFHPDMLKFRCIAEDWVRVIFDSLVTSRFIKNEFEPTNSPSVSDITCVEELSHLAS